jgi:hypothetical protein
LNAEIIGRDEDDDEEIQKRKNRGQDLRKSNKEGGGESTELLAVGKVDK